MAVTPIVSIVVPVFNGGKYLSEALGSAVSQSYKNLEVIVVDDCSTDNSIAIAQQYSSIYYPKVRVYVNESRLGMVANWHKCVELAQGEWVKFLCQDDLLDGHCISKLVTYASGSKLVVCDRRIKCETEDQDEIDRWYNYTQNHSLAYYFKAERDISPASFAAHMAKYPLINCIGEPSAVLIRKDIFSRLGGFNSDLIQLCDWEFFARIVVNVGLVRVPETLATFRVHNLAQTKINSVSQGYRSKIIDPLIVLYLLCYDKDYRIVRQAAKLKKLNLKFRLMALLDQAEQHARWDATGPHAVNDWQEVLNKYEKLRGLVRGKWKRRLLSALPKT